jgi:putative peptidoglycan lipid II flippase
MGKPCLTTFDRSSSGYLTFTNQSWPATRCRVPADCTVRRKLMIDPELSDITTPIAVPAGRPRRLPMDTEPSSSLGPGALVAGRYRLITLCGTEPHLQFWHGLDLATSRLVALSLVDVDGVLPVGRVNEVLSRTVRLRGLDVCGVARILDVLHTGDFGLVVAGWVPGGSLREIADTAPCPSAVAAALESLIIAADGAHRAGLVLSITSPSRIRISSNAHAVLAFPATMPEASPRDDLRGIGGTFYALLISRWPPQDPMPSGWAAADLDDAGWPEEPAAVDRDIPFLISSAAAGLLRPGSGVGSAATLLSLLRHARAPVHGQEHQANSRVTVMPAVPLPRPGSYAGFRNVDRAEAVKNARRQLMQTILVAAAAIFFVAVMSMGSALNRVLGENDDIVAMDADRLGLNSSATAVTPLPPAPEGVRQAAADVPVIPVKAAVFSPDGRPDNPESAGKAIDRDPATAWSTDRYYDADPFPKFKQGLGLLLQLPQPTALNSLTINVKGTGTVVQIRSAAMADPKALADTAELSAPTPLKPGPNRIQLNAQPPVSSVLIWISTLGSTDGNNRAEISEVTLSATARA